MDHEALWQSTRQRHLPPGQAEPGLPSHILHLWHQLHCQSASQHTYSSKRLLQSKALQSKVLQLQELWQRQAELSTPASSCVLVRTC